MPGTPAEKRSHNRLGKPLWLPYTTLFRSWRSNSEGRILPKAGYGHGIFVRLPIAASVLRRFCLPLQHLHNFQIMGYKFATKAIHAGQSADPTTGAVMTPIYHTSTYQQTAPGDHKGYEYSRGTNPTRKALEDCLAALENGAHGLAFSSGMAATEAVLRLLKPGDEVITGDDLYGGSYRMFTKVFAYYGITFHFVNTSEPERIAEKISPAT